MSKEAVADGMVQISEADLATLQAAYKTLNAAWTSPKHGLAVKKIIKDMKPDTSIPELDIAERYAKPLEDKLTAFEERDKKREEEIQALKKEREDEKALTGVYAKIDAVVKKRGLTDEGRAGLIKTMQDRQIADPEAAALVYLDSLPKPEAIKTGGNYLPQSMGMHEMGGNTKDDFAKFLENPMTAFDNAVVDVLNNPEQQAA